MARIPFSMRLNAPQRSLFLWSLLSDLHGSFQALRRIHLDPCIFHIKAVGFRSQGLVPVNLDIVLTVEEYKFVLTEVCPQQLGEGATDEETQAYQKCKKVDEMMQCYILASVSNVLQHQHQAMLTAYNMMMSFKEMFRDQNHAARLAVMRDLVNTTMVEGTSVRDHVLKMISLLNVLEILGSNTDRKTQVDIILQSLPDSF
ncbi:uncharacterized protein LOC130776700 [Actinidia eriantha]|uniref:uncharacterized protein LOC130776700 n=1 Tax=Actinidia eriantha TaxID=165200 RepID=UPI00258CF498|nr:uncharacterized protein LOC130776700 [Actinidia eriantha]